MFNLVCVYDILGQDSAKTIVNTDVASAVKDTTERSCGLAVMLAIHDVIDAEDGWGMDMSLSNLLSSTTVCCPAAEES